MSLVHLLRRRSFAALCRPPLSGRIVIERSTCFGGGRCLRRGHCALSRSTLRDALSFHSGPTRYAHHQHEVSRHVSFSQRVYAPRYVKFQEFSGDYELSSRSDGIQHQRRAPAAAAFGVASSSTVCTSSVPPTLTGSTSSHQQHTHHQ